MYIIYIIIYLPFSACYWVKNQEEQLARRVEQSFSEAFLARFTERRPSEHQLRSIAQDIARLVLLHDMRLSWVKEPMNHMIDILCIYIVI